MLRSSAAAALALSIGVAMPTSAATLVVNLTAGGSQPVNGTVGNARSFTTVQGNASVTAKVSAFAISTTNSVNQLTNTINNNGDNKCKIGSATFNSATCITKSYLGDFSNGLGATSSGDSAGANNLHTIDNVGQQDFIIIQFDRKVKLISGTFTPYSVSSSTDSDATIGVRNLAVQSDLGNNAAINLTSRASLNQLIGTQYERDSSLGNVARLLDPNDYVGRLWLVAASLQTSNDRYYDNKKDGFKLKDLKVQIVGQVPEPASWAMMIAGFGFVGGAMRRNRLRGLATA